jgi:4-amino-4-deoxy-L-arabinose transferase-like glycosyltransferase
VSRGEGLLLVALALLLFLPGIGARDLWNPDEPRYAEVAREMRASGSLFVPRLNGRTYAEKPPLLFWAIAACDALPGVRLEVAARLPSVFAAALTLLVLFDLARRLFDRRVAWLAVLVFASSAKILWQGRIGQIDMLLTALVTAAMAGFVSGVVDERPARYRLFFLCAGLATLAKGPAGLLPPLLAIVVWGLATGRRDLLRALRIPTGLLVWAGVVALWLVPAALAGGRDYLDTILFRQNLTRYADPWHHLKPWYYYLKTLPGDFFPWSFLLPSAVWIGARRIFDERRRGFTLLACWALVTLVFFSLSPAKRTVYLLTAYPALAALVALGLSEIEGSFARWRRWLTLPLALVAAVATLLPLAGWLAVRFAPERVERPLAALRPLGPGVLPLVALVALLVAAGAQAALLAARRGAVRRAVQALAAGMGAAAIAGALFVLPRFDAVKSARPVAEKLLELALPSEPYALWPHLDPPVVFYARRFAVELADQTALYAFARSPRKVWLLVERDDLERLPRPLGLVEVARDQRRADGYVFLTSPPPH